MVCGMCSITIVVVECEAINKKCHTSTRFGMYTDAATSAHTTLFVGTYVTSVLETNIPHRDSY